MIRRRHPHGLASRFLIAQLLVVAASLVAAVVVASLAGPLLFHEHLLRAGVCVIPRNYSTLSRPTGTRT